MKVKRATKSELEQVAAYEDRMAAEYEARAADSTCNGRYYLGVAAKRRDNANSLRALACEKGRRR